MKGPEVFCVGESILDLLPRGIINPLRTREVGLGGLESYQVG
jgi:hypothetical protein